MNKKKFLEELNKGLKPLSKSEIDEILDFYDERITNGTRSGKTEQDVINELEPINVIVKNTLLEFGIEDKKISNINKDDTIIREKTVDSKRFNLKSYGKIVKYLKLGVFDILLASWLVIGSIFLLLITLVIPITLVFLALTSFLTTYNTVIQLCLFTGTMSVALLTIILVKTVWLITKYIVQFVLNVNYNALNGTTDKKFKFNYNVRRSLKRYKLGAITSLFLLVVSGTGFLINYGDFKDNYLVEPTGRSYQYLETDTSIEKDVYIWCIC